MTFFVGSTGFRAPRDVVSFDVGSDGDRVNLVTLIVYLPDMLPISEAPDIQNVNAVVITLAVRDGLEFPGLPLDPQDAKAKIERRFGQESYVQSIDDDLGLYRIVFEGRENYAAYRRLDNRQRPGDVRIPYVECSGSALSNGWPCTSYGEIPPNIRVKYEFYEANIKHWTSIDAQVFNLIESYRVAEEQAFVD